MQGVHRNYVISLMMYLYNESSICSISAYRFMLNCLIRSWLHDLHSCNTSIIRAYRSYKLNFGMECYLKHVNNSKFRVALSKLRTSSHSLEIERGRYTRPKLNVDQRLCMSCNVEDEEHFVLHCQDNRGERELLFQKYIWETPLFSI